VLSASVHVAKLAPRLMRGSVQIPMLERFDETDVGRIRLQNVDNAPPRADEQTLPVW
jgi:hypothetical protein